MESEKHDFWLWHELKVSQSLSVCPFSPKLSSRIQDSQDKIRALYLESHRRSPKHFVLFEIYVNREQVIEQFADELRLSLLLLGSWQGRAEVIWAIHGIMLVVMVVTDPDIIISMMCPRVHTLHTQMSEIVSQSHQVIIIFCKVDNPQHGNSL